MMTTIAMPLWLLSIIIGLPCICLLGVAVSALGSRAKKGKMDPKECFNAEECRPAIDAHFQSNLLSIQIDAVFNAMAALIETERIKIKALVSHADIQPSRSGFAGQIPEQKAKVESHEGVESEDIGAQITIQAARGKSFDEIAAELGLSRAEIDLALKLKSSETSERRKLEAVA